MPETLLASDQEPPAAEPWTRREIFQQPETLRATQAMLRDRATELESFLRPVLADPSLRIVLTGAGTSAFIGESLAPWLSRVLDRTVEAVPTTDIVSAPGLYLDPERATLLVSFGRSGNSPESIAALDLADAQVARVHHLILTCNGEGQLAQRSGPDTYVFVLPTATHDRGFAMTSSFSAMMYAALSIFTGAADMDVRADAIAQAMADLLDTAEPKVAALAGRGFERVVYLGSGVLKGLAREAALKLLELTDGALVTAFDSTMGFRHGPKTIVTPRTLVVVFVSNDPLTRRYDLDMIQELRADGRCASVIAVSARKMDGDVIQVSHLEDAVDADLLFPFIVPAQLFALHASMELGLTPDQPNKSGTVNRVVQGVRLYVAG